MRIGILYMGNDSTRIWGGGVITHQLAEALANLGHDVWRAPALEWPDWSHYLSERSDVVIVHGVPATRIPDELWNATGFTIYWWLTELFYTEETILQSPFDAIAVNSSMLAEHLRNRGRCGKFIELAATPSFATAAPRDEYKSFCTYLGLYPHKTPGQLERLLDPAVEFGLTVWGRGWEDSPYKACHRGVLPLLDVGSLYRSTGTVMALTEERQKRRGMVNNRIFEALAAGAVVVSDSFAELEAHELGRYIQFAPTSEDVHRILASRKASNDMERLAADGQRAVLERHTYHHRALQFLALAGELQGSRPRRKTEVLRPSNNHKAENSASFEYDTLAIAIHPSGGRPISHEDWWGLRNVRCVTSHQGPEPGAIKVKYPANSASPTVRRSTGAPLGGAQFLMSVPGGTHESLNLRYYVRFPEGFDFVKGGKLPGLFGGTVWSGGRVPDGTNGFSCRYMWRENGFGEVYAYVPACEKFGISIGRGAWQFKPGVWHLLEQEVILNDPSLSDGIIRVWFDEALVVEQSGMQFRTVPDLGIEGILFSTFFGGGDPSWSTPENVEVTFCGFRTGGSYIGKRQLALTA